MTGCSKVRAIAFTKKHDMIADADWEKSKSGQRACMQNSIA